MTQVRRTCPRAPKGCTRTFLWAPRLTRPASAPQYDWQGSRGRAPSQQTALVGGHFREWRVGHHWIISPHSSSLLSLDPPNPPDPPEISNQDSFSLGWPTYFWLTSLCLSHFRQLDLGSIMPSSSCSRPHISQTHHLKVMNLGHVIFR